MTDSPQESILTGRRLMIYLAFTLSLATVSGYVWMIRSLAGAR